MGWVMTAATFPEIDAEREQTRALAACRGTTCRVADSFPVPPRPDPQAVEPSLTGTAAAS